MAYPTDLTNINALDTDRVGTGNLIDVATDSNAQGTAIQAIAAKVGVNSSAVTSSLDYRVATLEVGGSGAPTNATYIVQTANVSLSNEQALGALATGIVKNTTTTGVLSIAAQGTDYYAPAGTDVAVADGGTGASDAATARTNLGLGNVDNTSNATERAATATLTNKTIDADGTGNVITNIGSSEIKSEIITGLTAETAIADDDVVMLYDTSATALRKMTKANFVSGLGGGSGIVRSVSSISSPTTAGATAATDYVYFVTGTTTLTLPTAVSNTNCYSVTNFGSNTVTVATTSSQTINGSTTVTLIPGQALNFISNNANWAIF